MTGFDHIETSALICIGNQWSGFYMIGTPAMKELNTDVSKKLIFSIHSSLKECHIASDMKHVKSMKRVKSIVDYHFQFCVRYFEFANG